ncbi:hypothetical protein QAD02_006063 [Eretmocerus hayati]|uniref:Uncharacterized protein n=1 Tax=Eretmocerus hayati TaxID=131215 RepID=A0ACC2N0C7_9HYME|nr:hypothetical protein QAD02_006063 [Eretmocerus hayati]
MRITRSNLAPIWLILSSSSSSTISFLLASLLLISYLEQSCLADSSSVSSVRSSKYQYEPKDRLEIEIRRRLNAIKEHLRRELVRNERDRIIRINNRRFDEFVREQHGNNGREWPEENGRHVERVGGRKQNGKSKIIQNQDANTIVKKSSLNKISDAKEVYSKMKNNYSTKKVDELQSKVADQTFQHNSPIVTGLRLPLIKFKLYYGNWQGLVFIFHQLDSTGTDQGDTNEKTRTKRIRSDTTAKNEIVKDHRGNLEVDPRRVKDQFLRQLQVAALTGTSHLDNHRADFLFPERDVYRATDYRYARERNARQKFRV